MWHLWDARIYNLYNIFPTSHYLSYFNPIVKMRFFNLVVLLFALLLVCSDALKIGNTIKKVGDTVKKVAGNLPQLAKCAAQGAPYVAPLGTCIAIPNPISCVQGVQGAQEFLASCCGVYKSAQSEPLADKFKQLCDRLAM
jgi:hypothetical protein